MNHYTYEIEFENGMKYIGVRSCKVPVTEDSYYGSSKAIPSGLYATCNKRILNTFDTRIDALLDEAKLHEELDIAVNVNYYNQVKQTSLKFDQQGTTKETHEHIARMAEKLKGRTKQTHEYLAKSGKKSAALRGENRTTAQKAADKLVSKQQKGVKNPGKGTPGASHSKYRPWYYVTPEGEYNEVHTTLRQYVLSDMNTIGVMYSTVSSAIANKAHYPLMRGVNKGYIFGYLYNKPEYLTQENILIAIQVLQHLPFESPNKVTQKFRANRIESITGKK